MELKKAKIIASKYVEQLRPFCKRIEIAGSIRREKPEVKDIEIVCIRDTKKLYDFRNSIQSLRVIKGSSLGRYCKINLEEGIDLDLFMYFPENWGLIFAIRTGSAEFSHQQLAAGWVKAGYKSVDGMLMKDGENIPVPEEKDLFKLIGLNYIEPKFRTQ